MTTKRQHLVWRDYPAPWTDNPDSTDVNIACYYKEKYGLPELERGAFTSFPDGK